MVLCVVFQYKRRPQDIGVALSCSRFIFSEEIAELLKMCQRNFHDTPVEVWVRCTI